MSGYFIVEQTLQFKRKDGSTRPSIGYWFGPNHGWGTTTSTTITDSAVARFTSRDQAERALRDVYGSFAEAKRRGYKIIRDPR